MTKIIDDELQPLGEVDKVNITIREIFKNPEIILSGALETYAPSPLKAVAILPRLFRAARVGIFWEQFYGEINRLKEIGKVKENYFESEQARACFQEMTNATEDPSIDKIKFDALKNIFIKALTENDAGKDTQLPLLYMRTINDLSSDEVYFLGKCYSNIVIKDFDKTSSSAYQWLKSAGEITGFPIGAITKLENNLMNQGLIGDRIHSDRSGIRDMETFRFTDFAIEMCKFMSDSNPTE